MSDKTGVSAIIPPHEKENTKLTGNMGVVDVIFTVVAYNGPAVVFMGFLPVLILWGNGLGAPALIIAVGLLLAVVASGLLKVSEATQRPGGFYSLISAGAGRVVGLGAGFTALMTYFAAAVSVYVIGGIAFGDLVVDFLNGPNLPWWVGGAIMLVFVAVLGYLSIQFSARVLYVLLGAEFVLIAAYIIAVLAQGGADGLGLDSFKPEHIFSGSLAVGALFAVTIFGGFEATVVFREEVKNPDRTIKRATYGVVALLAGSYALLAWTFINAYGPSVILEVLAEDVSGAAGASVMEYVGPWGYFFANLLLFTSALALALASHNILTRYVYNFGVDRIFSRSMAASHPKHGSPFKASFFVSVACVVGVIGVALTPIDEGILYGTVVSFVAYGMIILMTLVTLAIGLYMFRNRIGNKLHVSAMFISSAIFFAALFFASVRFDLLSGLSGPPAIIAQVVCWLFILSGVALAAWLKSRKPDVYARVGRRED
ncbi:MAG: APC family permease [Gulosibacter sp.]|uniref:APC family permease n=1 Tax=Gulosibacter sp. TaxID=2817531 RepID=UPI003F924E22